MSAEKFLGIFVNPVYVQNEGLSQVFDNLERAGARAVAISTRVAHPVNTDSGVRFPDLHMDGYERLVARPVWGKGEQYLEFFNAFDPNPTLYEGCPYQPVTKPVPAQVDREIPFAMVAEARKRGMQIHIQLHPFVPPSIRPAEQPIYPDGSTPQPPQITLNACVNNPKAQAYGLALIEDALRHFDNVDGLFTDWVEFGAYRLQDHFTCLCAHCRQKATELGLDWERIQKDVTALWHWLHVLTSQKLEVSRRISQNSWELLELLTHYSGWLQFLRLKAESVAGFYRQVRQLLDNSGMQEVTLSGRGWPPPWNRSSGMDYRLLAEVCGAVTPKLFTFDYCALPRWYGQTLLDWNPELSEQEILDTLVEWLQLPDDFERRSFANYHIPAPEEPHPARLEAYRPRLDEVVNQVSGRALVYPFSHAYLPEPQWKRMLALIRDSRVDGLWVQMYG